MLVLLGSVTTSAVTVALCIKNLVIWLLAKDAWRIDITVEPSRRAQMMTLKRAFLLSKESAPKANAANEICHGGRALCNNAPVQIAPPRATAL